MTLIFFIVSSQKMTAKKTSLKEFKDKNKKKNAWQQVAQQLGLESGE